MLTRIVVIAIHFIGFMYGATLHAETQTEYAIDIVIFEDSEGRYLNSEQWSSELTAGDTTATEAIDVTEATSGGLTKKPDKLLPPDIRDIDTSQYELLDSAVKRLSTSSRYHILARKSWLQPGLDREHAVDINISNPPQVTGEGPADNISGTVKIVLERYLHLYTDLVYHKPNTIQIQPASETVNASNPPEAFIIREHRRMRSKELHYIDHPLVGILIKIVPVETKIKAVTRE